MASRAFDIFSYLLCYADCAKRVSSHHFQGVIVYSIEVCIIHIRPILQCQLTIVSGRSVTLGSRTDRLCSRTFISGYHWSIDVCVQEMVPHSALASRNHLAVYNFHNKDDLWILSPKLYISDTVWSEFSACKTIGKFQTIIDNCRFDFILFSKVKTHTRTHFCIHTYIHTYIVMYTHTNIHKYIHACILIHIHICMQTYTHTYIHTRIQMYRHTNIQTCIHM